VEWRKNGHVISDSSHIEVSILPKAESKHYVSQKKIVLPSGDF